MHFICTGCILQDYSRNYILHAWCKPRLSHRGGIKVSHATKQIQYGGENVSAQQLDANIVKRYLRERQIVYSISPDETVFFLERKLDEQTLCKVSMSVFHDSLLIAITFPIVVTNRQRNSALKQLNEYNRGLYNGCMEMDYSSGIIQYRTCMMPSADEFSSDLLDGALKRTVQEAERVYVPFRILLHSQKTS